jgi:hypothetical protein
MDAAIHVALAGMRATRPGGVRTLVIALHRRLAMDDLLLGPALLAAIAQDADRVRLHVARSVGERVITALRSAREDDDDRMLVSGAFEIPVDAPPPVLAAADALAEGRSKRASAEDRIRFALETREIMDEDEAVRSARYREALLRNVAEISGGDLATPTRREVYTTLFATRTDGGVTISATDLAIAAEAGVELWFDSF